jgi:transposase
MYSSTSSTLANLDSSVYSRPRTGRPAYHPGVLLKLYIYGYLNRIQSSRRLEREAQRNVELMWLMGRLTPDFKTIANFRKDNGKSIRAVCRQFIVLCQQLDLFSDAVVAIDGSKFKAVNSSDRNFTDAKLKRRMEEIESNISRYLAELDTADRHDPATEKPKRVRLEHKILALKSQMATLKEIEAKLVETGEAQISLTDPDARSNFKRLIAILCIANMLNANRAYAPFFNLQSLLWSIALALPMKNPRQRYGAAQRLLTFQN